MNSSRILMTIAFLGVILAFSGCGGSKTAAETPQDKQFGLLSAKTWKLSSVTLGGTDQNTSAAWTNFVLTISGTKGSTSFNYSCAGRPALSPWPASGTWAFDTNPVTQIIRDQGTANALPITYSVTAAAGTTAATLQISFSYTGNGYTRVGNVSGSWVFNFTGN